MLKKNNPAIICCGRPITHQEIKDIQGMATDFSNLSRFEFTETICEYLNWRTAAGANKTEACMVSYSNPLASNQVDKIKAKKF